MKIPLVVIQIVNFNGRENLGNVFFECYESIFYQTYKNFIVHTIDNKSTDSSVADIHRKFPSVKVTLINKNMGYSSNSIGLKYFMEIGAEYLLVMNNDVILEKQCIENMIDFMEKNNKVGASNPMILLNQKKDILCSTGVKINRGGFSSNQNFLMNKCDIATKEEKVFLSGACMMVRKGVIDLVGLFDYVYESYYEDSDFSLKMLSETDYSIALVQNALCFHEVSASYKKSEKRSEYLLLRNQYLFLMKRFPLIDLSKALFYLLKTRFLRRNILHIKILLFLILHFPSILSQRIISAIKRKNNIMNFIDSSFAPYYVEKISSERTIIYSSISDENISSIPCNIIAGVTDRFLGEGFSMLSNEFPISRKIRQKGTCFIKNCGKKYLLVAYPEKSKAVITVNNKEKIAGETPIEFEINTNEEILKIEIEPEKEIKMTFLGATDGE